MRLSIGGQHGKKLGEATDITVHGFPVCGAFGVLVNLKVNAGKLSSNASLHELQCRIELVNPSLKIASGFIEGYPAIHWTPYSEVEQLGFHFYLSGSQVEAIEARRCGGDLQLAVLLSGSASYEGEAQSFADRDDFLVPKQQWLGALKAMNYHDSLLFELRMPRLEAPESDSMRRLLERAQSHICNGNYQDAVASCRQIIEQIEIQRNDKKAAADAVAKHKGNRRQDMSSIERMLFIREALKNLLHLGSHHGDEFSRQQAQAALGMTVALLSCPEVGVPAGQTRVDVEEQGIEL